ncbi:hypothetical protein [Sphaerisporangium perillae]|uniref:hypothetical protein n=1 Tax=Sphaerisporangium perillae TaxID=2935860 RepID=UPI0020101021|nr:hypothetical protein [Sphaerisporangium perillae]
MLDWLIRPHTAMHTIGEIVGGAEHRLMAPRAVSQDSIATALALDGKLDDETRESFLEKVFSPAAQPTH